MQYMDHIESPMSHFVAIYFWCILWDTWVAVSVWYWYALWLPPVANPQGRPLSTYHRTHLSPTILPWRPTSWNKIRDHYPLFVYSKNNQNTLYLITHEAPVPNITQRQWEGTYSKIAEDRTRKERGLCLDGTRVMQEYAGPCWPIPHPTPPVPCASQYALCRNTQKRRWCKLSKTTWQVLLQFGWDQLSKDNHSNATRIGVGPQRWLTAASNVIPTSLRSSVVHLC